MQKNKNQSKKNNYCGFCGGLIVLERYLQDRWLRCTGCNKEVHFIS